MYSPEVNEDILLLLLKTAARVDISYRQQWKVSLRLLSVCSRWRAIALPYVYSCMWVSYKNSELPVATNTDLIAQLGLTNFVRRCDIDVKLSRVYANLNPAVFVLKRYAEQWPAIKHLSVKFNCFDEFYSELYTGVEQYINPVNETIKDLVGILPNITCLNFGSGATNQLAKETYRKIASYYTTQVRQLTVDKTSIADTDIYFQNVLCLNMSSSYCGDNFPFGTNATALKHLSLHDISSEFLWTTIDSKQSVDIVEFSNLLTLQLSYSRAAKKHRLDGQCVPKHKYALHFPQLEYLDLSPDCCSYPLLEHGVFSSGIDYVHVNATFESLCVLSKIKLPRIGVLSMDINLLSSNNLVSAFKYINHISTRVQRTGNIKLVVDSTLQVPISNSINCSSLSELVIKAPVNYEAIQQIITQLQNLKSLEIHQFVFDETQPDFDDDPSIQAMPFNLNVSQLKFNYTNRHCPREFGEAFLQYLLLRLSQLDMFVAKRISSEQMQAFVSRFEHSFPHLCKIEYQLNMLY